MTFNNPMLTLNVSVGKGKKRTYHGNAFPSSICRSCNWNTIMKLCAIISQKCCYMQLGISNGWIVLGFTQLDRIFGTHSNVLIYTFTCYRPIHGTTKVVSVLIEFKDLLRDSGVYFIVSLVSTHEVLTL